MKDENSNSHPTCHVTKLHKKECKKIMCDEGTFWDVVRGCLCCCCVVAWYCDHYRHNNNPKTRNNKRKNQSNHQAISTRTATMASTANAAHTTTNDKVALVFGISGDQGQAVAKGLLSTRSYKHVYGVTRDLTEEHIQSIERHMSASSSMPAPQTQQETNTTTTTTAVTFLQVDLNNPSSLRSVFESTRATDIFLVTTTDMPPEEGAMGSFHESEEREYESIVSFFNVLVEVHRKEWYDEHASQEETKKPLERHVIFSTLDNVRGLVEWLESHGETKDVDELLKIKPSDDGGIVPHYSGKGRGAEHALSLIHGIPSPWKEQHPESSRSSSAMNPPWMTTSEPTQSIIDGLSVTLVTLPFLHSNFSASAIPLPTNSKGRTIEWSISACLGDSSHPLDMFSVSDLQYVIPTLFQQRAKYQGRTVRLSAEKLTMDDVAYQFSDLFGKDVIYSPLTVEEMSSLEGIPGVSAWAQMCQYLASAYASHDVEETERIMGVCGKKPQKFQDWLLTHSDDAGFEKVGLSLDANPIQCVTVFNATSMQGESVIKGLLADTRKQYSIRACIGYEERQHEMEADVKRIQSLDPERITIHFVNIDDVHSCTTAVEGADGAFVLTDFYKTHPQEGEELEEKNTRTIIDACHQSTTVRHIVLSTLESADDVNNELQDCAINDNGGMLDAKARMAAYARAKNISVTYVLMPVYSESFFRTMAEKIREGREGAEDGKMNIDKADDSVNESDVLSNKDERVVCISIDDLGPAVANIFDSYEVYAGHEIGLITDVLSFSEANDIIRTVFFETKEDAELGSIPESLDQSSYSTSSSASLAMLAQSECRVVDTFPKDLGNIFRAFSKTELVKQRHLVAKTMELVPDAKPFRLWLEENRDNTEFREMLGLR